ncbi:MAG: cytochrome ubiquinol oxidase subunit I [Demequinaceae bacterium]|nr:cytochrome ubiquinol oxidase subunit I [Demequinaceae bacterium]
MDVLELARWQFGITTVYHFFLVPLTIGLSVLVAILQTAWVRTGNPMWLRLTKFYGKLLMINFALGVATGIVQEFQFGMNWSEYSRYVGDVFGAPLAMEALAAFFLESTFLGLWIFGWDRLSKRLHLACLWLFSIGTILSAYFIIAANSWMQHPVGATYNPETGRAEMTDIGAVLTNSTTLAAFPHVIASAFLVAGTVVAGIAGAWLVKGQREAASNETAEGRDGDRALYRTALRFGAVVMLISGVAVVGTGDHQGKLMVEEQPMKMAAAEGICDTDEGVGFSVFALPGWGESCDSLTDAIVVPKLASFLFTGRFDGEIRGINDLQAEYEQMFGPGDYSPNVPVAYWSFRLMIYLGAGSAALALAALFLTRKGRSPSQEWFRRLSLWAIPTPFLAASFGWIFTEMGRQPWVVYPNLTGTDPVHLQTLFGVSTSVSAGEVLTSMIVFTVVYLILGVFWYRLMRRYAAEGAPDIAPEPSGDPSDQPLSFAY